MEEFNEMEKFIINFQLINILSNNYLFNIINNILKLLII